MAQEIWSGLVQWFQLRVPNKATVSVQWGFGYLRLDWQVDSVPHYMDPSVELHTTWFSPRQVKLDRTMEINLEREHSAALNPAETYYPEYAKHSNTKKKIMWLINEKMCWGDSSQKEKKDKWPLNIGKCQSKLHWDSTVPIHNIYHLKHK